MSHGPRKERLAEVLLILAGSLLACRLGALPIERQIETQVAATVNVQQVATELAADLGTQIAATASSDALAQQTDAGVTITVTATDTPSPSSTATPSPTNTLRPAPTMTPEPTATRTEPVGYTLNQSRPIAEADGIVYTSIQVQSGDRLEITASGEIWSGVAFTGTNGPDGWTNTDCDPKFPLPCSYPYSLLARIGPASSWQYIGSSRVLTSTGQGELILGINDDTPGNGSGEFIVRIMLTGSR